MREIKFRAWDKIDKEMRDVLQIDWMDSFVIVPIPILVPAGDDADIDWDWEKRKFDDVILMQYTGLKDKNGREIFEGDIIRHNIPKKTERGTYDLNKSETVIKLVEWRDYVSCGFNIMGCTQNIYEVIGNIHENPELK